MWYRQPAPPAYPEEDARRDALLDCESDLKFSLANDPDTPEWEAYRARLKQDIERLKAGSSDPILLCGWDNGKHGYGPWA